MSASALFHPLRVRAVRPDTPEAVIVTFEVPDHLCPVFGFTQGQYLTLRHAIAGQDLRRSYSICAGVDDGVPARPHLRRAIRLSAALDAGRAEAGVRHNRRRHLLLLEQRLVTDHAAEIALEPLQVG